MSASESKKTGASDNIKREQSMCGGRRGLRAFVLTVLCCATVFPSIGFDGMEGPDMIDSLCMNCQEQVR